MLPKARQLRRHHSLRPLTLSKRLRRLRLTGRERRLFFRDCLLHRRSRFVALGLGVPTLTVGLAGAELQSYGLLHRMRMHIIAHRAPPCRLV